MECQPGEEAQVDFRLGVPIEDGRVKARKSWVFRMVLSYSRKAYSGAVSRQDTETFLRCLENGLRSFGGSPLLLNLDNLKAAVLKADWFDPATSFPLWAEMDRRAGAYGASFLPSWLSFQGLASAFRTDSLVLPIYDPLTVIIDAETRLASAKPRVVILA